MNLFDQAREQRIDQEAPLAARMRPRTLDEFIGQEHIVGPGRLLRRAIQADQLSSLIFYGPPGTGKTTLARVIANSTRAHFIALNAVLAGVKDIRESVESAQEHLALYAQRTILFVDEVHRFNKAQQDALLPWVENGTVIFIGATTENPYFEVNKALVSRSRIFQLKPLERGHLIAVARQALQTAGRGYGHLHVQIDEDALLHLVDVANGDARAVLNALELAVETTVPTSAVGTAIGGAPPIRITLAIAEESIQRRAVLYDKEGDYHFDTISAFIKSLRGSDPDAAMYWMAKMVYAGEEPRFILRRMLIFASEDVGLADPHAVAVVAACADAFDRIGMPEGRFPLAQAALYLATTPKSNSAFALFDALQTIEKEPEGEVPNHLRDTNRDREGFGHGEGYLYPHAYRDHWVAQQYLPGAMQGKVFYQPTAQGYEATIRLQVTRRREAQLAAMVEHAAGGAGLENLTFSPQDAARDRWLQRTISSAGQRLAATRDRILDGARLMRHSTVLDLNAGSGLLTWEALRRVPEGGLFALARTAAEAAALTEQAQRLPAMERPTVLEGDPAELERAWARANLAPVRCDALVGRNVLVQQPDKVRVIAQLCAALAPGGTISLAERIPRYTQRLYRLLDLASLAEAVRADVVAAEEQIYADLQNPMVNWDADILRTIWLAAYPEAAAQLKLEVEEEVVELQVTDALLQRWFGEAEGGRLSYRQHLASRLSPDQIGAVYQLFRRQLLNCTVPWRSRLLYLSLQPSAVQP